MFSGEIIQDQFVVNHSKLAKICCSGEATIQNIKEVSNLFCEAIADIETDFLFDVSELKKVSISFLQLLISFKKSAAIKGHACHILEISEVSPFFKIINDSGIRLGETGVGFNFIKAQEIKNAKDSCS